MFINDLRNKQIGVAFNETVAGEVYLVSEYYVMCTDEGGVVNLSDGVLWSHQDFTEHDIFFPVNAKLEIS